MDPRADSPKPPGGAPAQASARALASAAGLAPSRVRVVESIGSTNLALMQADWGPEPDGPRVLLTRQQTEGRGRRGRVWLSGGDESLTLSVSLELPLPDGGARLAGLSVRTGVEIAECLAGFTDGLALKWPNDLQRHGRKVAGLLCESRLQADRVRVVAGLGVNLLPAAGMLDQVGQPAGTLFDAPADLPDRWRLAGLLAAALLRGVAGSAPRAPLPDRWAAFDALAGAPVEVLAEGAPALPGIADGIEPDGALRLRVGDIVQRISVGEVSLRRRPVSASGPAS
ncbi:MAG: biotin--[acetyl-CoA-carboxylase] ligase [Burkholderiales bacterium]